MKKIFGSINLTWKKIIVMGIIAGIYTAIMAMIKPLKDTFFTDLTVSFEVWILFGIFIIMNSKSAKDSALKCFIFFLISQPLVYLVQDIVNHSKLFITYYRFWVLWTIACIPMGYIGYYIKKDKWWGIIILTPILVLLGLHYNTYLATTIYAFPRHLLTTIFCLITLFIYPIVMFNNKKIEYVGLFISTLIFVLMTILTIKHPFVYKTDLISNGKYHFDNTYKVYLEDEKYGKVNIRYEEAIEDWMVHAEFKHAGKTKFVLESPAGVKQEFNLVIKTDSYEIYEIKKK